MWGSPSHWKLYFAVCYSVRHTVVSESLRNGCSGDILHDVMQEKSTRLQGCLELLCCKQS